MQEQTEKTLFQRREYRTYAAAAAVFIFAFLLYAKTLNFDFVWDDFGVIVHNPHVHSPASAVETFYSGAKGGAGHFDPSKMVSHNYRPLRTLIHSLVWQQFEAKPLYYHLLNVIGHGLASMMLFLVLARLLRQPVPALCGALLFAAHPVLTETVCWAKNIEDTLGGFFLLLSFYFILCMRHAKEKSQKTSMILAVIFFCIALFSKISVAFFPVFLIAQWLIEKKFKTVPRIFSGISNRFASLFTGSMITGTVAVLFLRSAAVGRLSQGGYVTGDRWTTWLSMARIFLRYLKLEFIPTGLLADYQTYPAAISLSDATAWKWTGLFIAIFVTLTIIAWRTRLTLPWLWFWCALLPVANIVPMVQLGAERFLYLPTIAFAILAAMIMKRVIDMSRSTGNMTALMIFAFYFVMFSFGTWRNSERWRDDMNLWRDTVSKVPEAVRPRKNLMKAHLKRQQFKAALFHAAVVYEADPTRDNASYLGFLECMEADPNVGFNRLVKLKADSVLNMVGAASAMRGKYDFAKKCFNAAIAINNSPRYHENLRRLNAALEKARQRKKKNAGK